MRLHFRWPLMALLALALAACNLGPAPTPEPPTPTPRARAEQVAQSTEVAARITATAAARALPTATPTPRPSAAPRPTLGLGQNGNKPIKATPIEWHAVPLADGWLYTDPVGQFSLILPHELEEYPSDLLGVAALFIAEPGLSGRTVEANVSLWDIPEVGWVLPLSDITNMAMAEVRQYFGDNYVLRKLERIETGGHQIDRLTGHDLDEDYVIVQAYIVAGHTLHTVTFHAPGELFEAYLPLFDAILASYSARVR